jgi:steroid delta-isomerase-like uncharacterized protein
MATALDNEATVRRFYNEIWSQGNLATVDETFDPNFAFILTFTRTDTIEGFKQLVNINRVAFENLTYVPNEVVADDSKAAAWWTMSAKHVGTWRNVPASNKHASIQGLTFFWFTPEGKLKQAVVQNDFVGLMRQIGGIKTIVEG